MIRCIPPEVLHNIEKYIPELVIQDILDEIQECQIQERLIKEKKHQFKKLLETTIVVYVSRIIPDILNKKGIKSNKTKDSYCKNKRTYILNMVYDYKAMIDQVIKMVDSWFKHSWFDPVLVYDKPITFSLIPNKYEITVQVEQC